MSDTGFVEAVASHIKQVEKLCVWPENGIPLLADQLDLQTNEPVRWEGHWLSNLACQQNFLRALDGMGTLTGDADYHRQANEWIGNAFEKLQDPASGLLHWGGHTSYDLQTVKPVLGNHELKSVFLHYSYLYQVDPEATRRFVEAFWHAHIWDWSTLLFNRHGDYVAWEYKWDAEFNGGDLPIVDNSALSFVNTGSDLILSGAILHAESGDETPLRWAQSLLSRYDQIRHPDTGLAGYQFNHREPCRVRLSFKPPLHTRADLNEVNILTNGVIATRYGRAAVAWLNASEALGEEKGKPFRELVVADLEALAEHAYDESESCFFPVLNDGT